MDTKWTKKWTLKNLVILGFPYSFVYYVYYFYIEYKKREIFIRVKIERKKKRYNSYYIGESRHWTQTCVEALFYGSKPCPSDLPVFEKWTSLHFKVKSDTIQNQND